MTLPGNILTCMGSVFEIDKTIDRILRRIRRITGADKYRGHITADAIGKLENPTR